MNLHQVSRRAFRSVVVIVAVMGFVSLDGEPVMAQDYAVANATNAALVLDASTLATVATIPLPPTEVNFDVAVMPNQSLAFVARLNPSQATFVSTIRIIDLTQHPPVLAAGINPIVNPLGPGTFVEDLSLTADGRFLVVSNGNGPYPVGVIDTATRSVIGLYNFLPDHNSVEVCDNGSVLVTSVNARMIKRLTISAAGALVDTGQALALTSSAPMNVTCARGGTTGVVVNTITNDLRSFLVNGMTPVSTQVLPGTGGIGINVSISGDGTKVFGRRSSDFVTAYNFNSATGVIGAQLWSTNVGFQPSLYGVEQMALNPTGTRLFVSTTNSVLALNATTGAVVGSVAIVNPTGIALRPVARAPGDFDGDGRSEATVFRPSNGIWYIRNAVTGLDQGLLWGGTGDVPVPGDYDRDGKADMAVFRPSNGTWYVRQSSTAGLVTSLWGGAGDIPVQGDYDGDSRTDIAVFRASTGIWYIRNSNTGLDEGLLWGGAGDVPAPGDYDADGKTDMAVFRPSNGTWYIRPSSTGVLVTSVWGGVGDVAVSGDYDGDRRTDVAVFRASSGIWYIRNSTTGLDEGLLWGGAGDVPVPGDYDADGRTDMAVFRPSNGTWYLRGSNTGLLTTVVWGAATDIPVLRRE